MRASLREATPARERVGVRASLASGKARAEGSRLGRRQAALERPAGMLRRMRRWAPTPAPVRRCLRNARDVASDTSASPAAAPPAPARDFALPAETHLANLRQLTFGGENAEAYWSWAGDALILQARAARGGVRSDLPHAAGARRARRVGDAPGVERAGRDDLLVLPARRPRDHLRVDAGGRRRVPAAARSQPGLRLGAVPDYDIYRANADGSGARAAHRHAGLRRRGDGVRQGRLDRLHVGARRRPRALPDGRRRQERPAADPRRRATTAARSSTPTARRSSGARRARSRARSWTTTSACSRRTWCGRASSSSTSPTPTAPTPAR